MVKSWEEQKPSVERRGDEGEENRCAKKKKYDDGGEISKFANGMGASKCSGEWETKKKCIKALYNQSDQPTSLPNRQGNHYAYKIKHKSMIVLSIQERGSVPRRSVPKEGWSDSSFIPLTFASVDHNYQWVLALLPTSNTLPPVSTALTT